MCKTIGIPISDTDKILLLFFHMYASKQFTEEDIMKYKMIPNDDRNNWTKTLAYFIKLYATRKAYS